MQSPISLLKAIVEILLMRISLSFLVHEDVKVASIVRLRAMGTYKAWWMKAGTGSSTVLLRRGQSCGVLDFHGLVDGDLIEHLTCSKHYTYTHKF